MKIKINSKQLAQACQLAEQSCLSKSNIEDNLYLKFYINQGEFTVWGTDSIISTYVKIEADNFELLEDKDEKISVLVKDLSRLLSQIEGDITISTDENNRFEIKSESGHYDFAYMLVQYPLETSETASVSIDGNLFKRICDKVSHSIATDGIRNSMNGVYFKSEENKLVAVSTDGHRLTEVKMTADNIQDIEMIIPHRSFEVIKKTLNNTSPIQIKPELRTVFFVQENVMVATRTVTEKFPNYKNVIPTENKLTAKVNLTLITSALNRINNFSKDNIKQARFDFHYPSNTLTVSMENVEMANKAEEKLSCELNGDVCLGMNPKYLSELLKTLEQEEVVFEIDSPTKAIIIRQENEDNSHLCLMMPLRLNN